MTNESTPWPRKGEQLFKSDIDWMNNACLCYGENLYAAGYKQAADLLVKYVLEKHIDQDTLVYPIVFLYRHYIELQLKEIISLGKGLDLDIKVEKDHELKSLWLESRQIIAEVWPEDSNNDIKAVQEIIHQFSACDPGSTAFRYPTTKKGKPSLTDLEQINLRNLGDIMAGIGSFFDGTINGISAYIQL